MRHQDTMQDTANTETITAKPTETQLNNRSGTNEKFLQFDAKTLPSVHIKKYAAEKAGEIDIEREKTITREKTIAVTKLFLSEQQKEFHSLPLGSAREELEKATPLTDEERITVEETARIKDDSPYKIRVEVWQEKFHPSVDEQLEIAQLLSKVEKLEAVETVNVHQRTAAEIADGKVKGFSASEKLFIGCDDSALLLLSNLRSIDIPASHVQIVNAEWIDRIRSLPKEEQQKELDRSYHGHILVRIYPAEGDPIWVDPASGAMRIGDSWEKFSVDTNTWEAKGDLNNAYLVKEGIDSTNSAPFESSTKERLQALIAAAPDTFVNLTEEILVSPESYFQNVFFKEVWPKLMAVPTETVNVEEIGNSPEQLVLNLWESLVPSLDAYIEKYELPTNKNESQTDEEFFNDLLARMQELNQGEKGTWSCWPERAMETGAANCALASQVLSRVLEQAGYNPEYGWPGPLSHAVVFAEGENGQKHYLDPRNGVSAEVVEEVNIHSVKAYRIETDNENIPFRLIPVSPKEYSVATQIWNLSSMKRKAEGKDSNSVTVELTNRYDTWNIPDAKWAKERILPTGWNDLLKYPEWKKEQEESSIHIQQS